jgi:transposase
MATGITIETTVGMDIGDRYSQLCVLDERGEVLETGRVSTTRRGVANRFQSLPPARVVIEASTHSPWIAEQLESYGHEVIVANPRRVALIYAEHTKSDEIDAETLARLGRLDPKLLHPIVHRKGQTLEDRALLRSRGVLVRSRTRLISHVRGVVKVHGQRLASCGADAFAKKQCQAIPEDLREALMPLLEMIESMTQQIRAYDRKIEELSEENYPETALMRAVTGVGPITALSFVVTIEDPGRFAKSRSVGSYVGLRPRRWQSGEVDQQMRITKAGDKEMRQLLVGSAHYILGPFGPDCDLRRFGMRLAGRGGKAAKKRAVVAVARKLAVLLHRLWVTGETYEPLRHATKLELRQAG